MGGYGALLLGAYGHFCAIGGHSPALWFSGADSAAGAFDDAEDYARHDIVNPPAALLRAGLDRRRHGATRSTTRPSTTRTRSMHSCTSGRAVTTAATGTRTCASTLRSMPGTAPDPKIELHVHLEGTVRPDTLRAIAKRNDYALPDDLESLYRFRDFAHFIEVFEL